MPKAKGEGGEREIKGCYVKAESLADLARYLCGVDRGVAPLFSIKSGSSQRLFVIGMKLKGVRLLYCYDVPRSQGFLVYRPMAEPSETAEISAGPVEMQDTRSFKVPVLELADPIYRDTSTSAKDFKSVRKIEMRDYRAMIKAMLAIGDHYNVMPELYSFAVKGERVIGCFDIVNESGMRVFTYARTGKRESFNYIQYDYSSDTVTTSETMGDRRHGVARIINVEGLPFF